MAKIASISQVHDGRPEPTLNVVFVHGLGSDAKAWTGGTLAWWTLLAELRPQTSCWTVTYETAKTEWDGHGPPFWEVARDLVHELHSTVLRDNPAPIVFVAHSMGGLVAKAVLRRSADLEQHVEILDRTSGVAFFGTPHTGSDLASIVNFMKFVTRPTEATQELSSHSESLLELNEWYRENAPRRGIETIAFRETKTTGVPKVMVVPAAFADPGITGVEVVALEGDHNEILNVSGREDRHVSIVLDFMDRAVDVHVAHVTTFAVGEEAPGSSVAVLVEQETVELILHTDRPLDEMPLARRRQLIKAIAHKIGRTPDDVLGFLEEGGSTP